MNCIWGIILLLGVIVTGVEVVQVARREMVSSSMMETYRKWMKVDNADDFEESLHFYMTSIMNASTDPCTDFYEYSCGNWKSFVLGSDGNSNETLGFLQDTMISELLQDDIYAANEVWGKARSFYTSCLGSRGIPASEVKTFLFSMGPWPILDENWTNSTFDLATVLGKAYEYGFDMFFKFSRRRPLTVNRLYEHITKNMFLIHGISRRPFDDLFDTEYVSDRSSYIKFISNMFSEMSISVENQDEKIEQVLDLELNIFIASIVPKPGESSHMKFQKVSKYLSLPETFLSNFNLTLDSAVYTGNSMFLENILSLIDKTSPEVLANYIFVNIALKFKLLSLELARNDNREQRCAGLVKKYMNSAVAATYGRVFFDQETKHKLKDLVVRVQASIADRIMESSLITNDKKGALLTKFRSVQMRLGYPESFDDENKLKTEYSALSMEPDHFFGNLLAAEKRLANSSLHQPFPWAVDTFKQNAAYSILENVIEIPLGIIQPPLFHKFNSPAANYGNLGLIIGHELMHAITGIDTMTEGPKRQCFVDNYNRISAGKKIPTWEEDLADFQGFQASFDAYEQLSKLEDQSRNEGLEDSRGQQLSPDQFFILNFAQAFCGFIPEDPALKEGGSKYSPSAVRVLGVLRSSSKFVTTFNCPQSSLMNSGNKCSSL